MQTMSNKFKKRNVLPGFGLTMGYTLLYLSVIVLVPLASLFLKTAGMTWACLLYTSDAADE